MTLRHGRPIVNVAKLLSPRLLSLPRGCFHVVVPSSVLADTLQAATALYIYYCTYVQVLLNFGSHIRLHCTDVHSFIQVKHYKSME